MQSIPYSLEPVTKNIIVTRNVIFLKDQVCNNDISSVNDAPNLIFEIPEENVNSVEGLVNELPSVHEMPIDIKEEYRTDYIESL